MENVVMPSQPFWSGRRVLLTGHTGFKGCWTHLWLEMLGATVTGLSLKPTGSPALWLLLNEPGGDGSIGDIRDPRAVERAFEMAQPEIVIHMAAQALVRPSYQDPVTTFDTNVMGLVQVLTAATRSSTVRAIVNVTSDKCYENTGQLWAYRENEPFGGSDPYSASKGCAELVTASFRRSFFSAPQAAAVATGRAGNVIGGGDWSVDRLLPDCLAAFERGDPVRLRNPLATRPWQHVLEPISGYLILAEQLVTKGHEVAEGWNFGPPAEEAWPVGRVVDATAQLWGEGARFATDCDTHPHEAQLLQVDASKARTRLGWKPALGVKGGLAWTVEWARGFLDGRPPRTLMRDQIERYVSLNKERQ